MDLNKFYKFLKGNLSSREFEELKKSIDSEEGPKFMDQLFDNFQVGEEEANEENLKTRLLDKIHDKIKIEELISEISREHERHQRILDKSRGPLKKNQGKGKIGRWIIAGSVGLIILAVGFYLKSSLINLPEAEIAEAALVTKSTGKGQKLTLHLPDGSRAILNSASSIKYPTNFTGTQREVYAEGEVFFEVVRNEKKPFVVHAGRLVSQVLGTSFNVRNRPEENVNTIALVTGKVQVSIPEETDQKKCYILTPGEAMELDPAKGIFQKMNFDIERETGWKDNIIYFTDANYHEVFETLENWYGVEINVVQTRRKPTWKLTAKFENENLENILNALTLSQGITYELNEKNVKIIL